MDTKEFMLKLIDRLYDRIIMRMNDYYVATKSDDSPSHLGTQPLCANPECTNLARKAKGDVLGYPNGSYYLYCDDCYTKLELSPS